MLSVLGYAGTTEARTKPLFYLPRFKTPALRAGHKLDGVGVLFEPFVSSSGPAEDATYVAVYSGASESCEVTMRKLLHLKAHSQTEENVRAESTKYGTSTLTRIWALTLLQATSLSQLEYSGQAYLHFLTLIR